MEEVKKISFTARGLGSDITPGYHADPESQGLYLQVTQGVKGVSKSWVFRYTSPTLFKRREMGLGSLDTRSLADARRRTLELRSMVLEGVDPTEERRKTQDKKISAFKTGITFKEAADRCIEGKKAEWKNQKHAGQWRSSLETFAIPFIGKLKVDQITTSHIVKLLEQEITNRTGKVEGSFWNVRTETATRVRQRIEVIFDWCKAHEYVSGDNPARLKGALGHLLPKAKKIQKKAHHPALPFQRISEFVSDLRAHNGYSALALELLILTAARTSEVIEAKWIELDLKAKVWTIPAERMKAGKEHRVPLNARAMEIIMHLKTIRANEFLFPSSLHKDDHLSNMALLSMMRKMSKYSEFVPHGFRSTFRDWAAETTDYPNETVELALAHTIKNKAEAAYRRQDQLDKRRMLMEDWSSYLKSSIHFLASATSD